MFEQHYEPLKMQPRYKEYLWGGRRLKTEYGKTDAPEIAAESWELASHPDGVSIVASGEYAGKTIADLGQMDKDAFWGNSCKTDNFPLMVKLIDAAKDLSIQVHPSDETALPGEQGKAEMWYIVDCEPQAFLYFGFSKQITKEEFLNRAQDGTICQVLNRVPVHKGDVFYILPGTIHAIGAGIVIAEIQQNSNTTFRIYDFQRRDANGNLRPLHLERAADVVSYAPIVPQNCRANSCAVFPGFSITEMFCCDYFRAHRIDVMEEITLRCDGHSFHHLLCVEGSGAIFADGTSCPFVRGDSYFLPAALGDYKIQGKCRMLLSRV